jgi:hypothetical protein
MCLAITGVFLRTDEPEKATQSSSFDNAADPSGAGAEHGGSRAAEEPSPAEMQLAGRIAEAVAGRLSQQAAHSAAGSSRFVPSNERDSLLPPWDPPEEAEQATPAEPCQAAKRCSLRSPTGVRAPGHACEQDFLAALLLGSTRASLYLSFLLQINS